MNTGAQRGMGGRGATLTKECEKWKLKHMANVNDINGGLGGLPQEKFHFLETLRVYF